jgi:hypothetical protein
MISPTLAAQIAALPLEIEEHELGLLETLWMQQSFSVRFLEENYTSPERLLSAGLIDKVNNLGHTVGYTLSDFGQEIVWQIHFQREASREDWA